MQEMRLGDELDDFCVKCKRVTNHAIVSLVNGQAAKVRCKSCYHDHDFRNSVPVPSKKELKKQQALFNQVLAGVNPGAVAAAASAEAAPAEALAEATAPAPAKKTARKSAK